MILIIILAVASVFSKYYIPNTIIADDFHLKAIEDTAKVIITTFLAVVAIFIISTPLLPFKMTYAATFICTDIDCASENSV